MFLVSVLWPTVDQVVLHILLNRNIPFIRPRNGNRPAFRAFARSMRYGKSKLPILYPITTSGSASSTKSLHACSISTSSLNEITCEPTILEQVFNVKILRTKGFDSPIRHSRHDIHENEGKNHTLPTNHISYLDYRIHTRFREDTLSASALNIKAEDPQRGDF